ncbi:MAG TPA: M48 family metallopeptidase [Gemmatimonadales bacterium]|nr:M48 family metallopeptidase [Gemmatimonadales bacterium]
MTRPCRAGAVVCDPMPVVPRAASGRRAAVRTAGAALAAAALLLAAPVAAARAQSLLDRVRQAANVARTLLPISTAKEIEIGRGIAATIAGRFPVSTDAALTRYVNLVGLTVASQAPRPDITYRFAVLETPIVNAYAAPGGYIFITRGSLAMIQSEAELAGVLAHEVGHVNRRHVIEGIRKSDTMREVRNTVDIEGATLDRVVGTGADALFTGLSRGDELEADSLGLEYAAAAGYDPGGLAAFVGRLDQHAGEGPVSEFFATHPKPDERVERLVAIAQREGLSGGVTLEDRYRAIVK